MSDEDRCNWCGNLRRHHTAYGSCIGVYDKKWEYEHSEGDWTVRGSYEEPGNIQFLYRGDVFRTMTVPSYTIWNYAAHLYDVIPELEELLDETA